MLKKSCSRAQPRKGVPPVQFYKKGSSQLIPKSDSIGRELVPKWGPEDDVTCNKSWRMLRPQQHFFEFPVHPFSGNYAEFTHHWQLRSYDFFKTETPIINAAFDVPEMIGLVLRDEAIAGRRDAYSVKWLNSALHWIIEARYWRCLGISKPFYEPTILRPHAWTDSGTNIGRIQFSAAMKDAVRDMERAVKRKSLGLQPNYVWDNWGPNGFIHENQRHDFLPRYRHNPYVDPDGVDVTMEDIAEFNTHEIIRERYEDLINPDPYPYLGSFLSVSNGLIQLDSFNDELVQLYMKLIGESDTKTIPQISQDRVRSVLYLSVIAGLYEEVQNNASTWAEAEAIIRPYRLKHDAKIDAARFIHHTSREKEEIRRFYEEKCGLLDFYHTNDKTLTAITIAQFADLKVLCGYELTADDLPPVTDGMREAVGVQKKLTGGDNDEQPDLDRGDNIYSSVVKVDATKYADWGHKLCMALTDVEKERVMGTEAFNLWKELEDMDLELRHEKWINRFSGSTSTDAKDEKTLDFMLSNFAKRPERVLDPAAKGEEFDRETEPIGRKVQRRVLDSDSIDFTKQDSNVGSTAADREAREALKKSRASSFNALHETQTFTGGVA